MSIRRLLLTILIALGLGLAAGCGGGSSGDDGGTGAGDNGGETDNGSTDEGGSGDDGATDGGADDGGSDDDGSDDSGGAAVTADGLWSGTVTEGDNTLDVAGLVYDGYIFVLADEQGIIYEGAYTLTDAEMSGDITVFYGPDDTAEATLSATVTPGDAIEGGYEIDGGGSGQFSLSYESIYDRDVTLQDLSANWTVTREAGTLTIPIDRSGAISGSDSAGCQYNGNATQPESGKNLFVLQVTVSSCGERDGEYAGYASLFDSATLENGILQLLLRNEDHILIDYLNRSSRGPSRRP